MTPADETTTWSSWLVSLILAKSDPCPPSFPLVKTASQKCTPTDPEFHSTSGCCVETSAGLIQVSMVKPSAKPTLRLAEAGTRTSALLPFRLNAWPTSPFVNVTPPSRVPLFEPAMSLALPPPGHQPTNPAG